jgi:ATP-binding cassette subfamily F protein 3
LADFSFEFKEPVNLPNPMLAITDADFGYVGEDGTKTILRGVNRSVLAGQRIGILGANGQGKSTLVKTIAREMRPLAGTVTEGKGLSIGYFAQQELDVLRPQDNPLEHMVRLAKELGPNTRESGREQDLRNFLGSFNFSGDMVKQAVGTMSGGEKARLVLAMMVWQRPNLLLLDEPTNHLDLATREALSIALNEFEGTVMLVSHDRALLRAVCDEFWLVGRGGVAPFDGDLDDYQQYLLDEARRLRELAREASQDEKSPETRANNDHSTVGKGQNDAKAVVPAPVPAADAREQRRQSAQQRQQLAEKTRPLRRELDAAERNLKRLGDEKMSLEARLAAPLAPEAIAEAGRRLKAVNDELDATEEHWLSLSGQIEAIEQAAG